MDAHDEAAAIRDEMLDGVRKRIAEADDEGHFYGAWRRGGTVSGGTMAKARATERRVKRERARTAARKKAEKDEGYVYGTMPKSEAELKQAMKGRDEELKARGLSAEARQRTIMQEETNLRAKMRRQQGERDTAAMNRLSAKSNAQDEQAIRDRAQRLYPNDTSRRAQYIDDQMIKQEEARRAAARPRRPAGTKRVEPMGDRAAPRSGPDPMGGREVFEQGGRVYTRNPDGSIERGAYKGAKPTKRRR